MERRVNFTDKTIEPVTMGGGGSLKLYAEMMRSLDDGVGRVMKAAESCGNRTRDTADLHK